MDLKIANETVYKIQVGAEVYQVEYPSFKEAQEIGHSFKGKDNDEAIQVMKNWLIKLGLDAKFFDLKPLKATHVMQIWKEINTVKK